MAGHSYEEAKKLVIRGLILLAVVTLVEVFLSLLGKGHIISSFKDMKVIHWVVGFLLIALSLYKAYYIVYEFMHLGHETKGMARSILLPLILLIWGIIAFLMEGVYWNKAKSYTLEEDMKYVKHEIPVVKKHHDADTKHVSPGDHH